MSLVPDVHALLHWANRSEVAREVTRRGYRVSVETLNRWHRDRKELPAVVERIIFDLFGVGHSETPPPWAEALQSKVDQIYDRQVVIASSATQRVIAALTDPERVEWVERIAAEIRAESERQSAAASDDRPSSGAQGGAGPTGPGLGSFPARDRED